MSAYLVDNKTINNILVGAIDEGIILEEEATRVGRKLLRANMFSLKDRYPDMDMSDRQRILKQFQFQNQEPTHNQVIQSGRCLNYQACEYKSWKKSDAYQLIKAVWDAKLKRLRIPTIQQWVRKYSDTLDWE